MAVTMHCLLFSTNREVGAIVITVLDGTTEVQKG